MPTDFEILRDKMDVGFGKVYGKLDYLREDYSNHMPVCAAKFSEIDKKIAVKEAINGEKKAQENIKRDWGMWFMRLTTGTIAVGALSLLWKLWTGGVRILGG